MLEPDSVPIYHCLQSTIGFVDQAVNDDAFGFLYATTKPITERIGLRGWMSDLGGDRWV